MTFIAYFLATFFAVCFGFMLFAVIMDACVWGGNDTVVVKK